MRRLPSVERVVGLRLKTRHAVAVIAAISIVGLGSAAGTLRASDERLASTVKPQDVQAHKRSPSELYVTSSEAHAAVQRDPSVLLIDIRTFGETVFSGVATPMHRHIPYMSLDDDHGYDAERRRYKLTPNPDFAKAIEQLFAAYKLGRNAPVILYCSTGERSAKAASYLSQIGYGGVYSMVDGFEGDQSAAGASGIGWKRSGLPWTLDLTASQVYKSPSM